VEGCSDGSGDAVDIGRRDERDGGAAEAAAGHPSAERARLARRRDREVELSARDLVVVPERGVRGIEQ